MRIAINAGSFDPVTYGHMWVFDEAAKLFDKVYICVGTNVNKIGKYKYPPEDRVKLIQDLVAPNVEVKYINLKLLAAFAQEVNANYIIKGVRDEVDFKDERKQHYANNILNPNLQTILIMPPKELEEVSSSFVKSFIGYDNWDVHIQKFVHPSVAKYMLEMENYYERKS
jgi:pantetheine-phosphate adenylyltransferase